MNHKISLRMTGIIAGSAAVFAFLCGIIITASIPSLANRSEASPEQPITVPLFNETGESPFTKIAEAVSPAVVNISAEKTVQRENVPGFDWRFEGPFENLFKDFFRDFPKYEGKTQTLGSGFLISDDGYIVTNYHVIKGAADGDIFIKLIDKNEYKDGDVKIVGVDQRTDIAVLKINTKDKLPFLKLGDSDNVRVGDWAIAFGNPFHLEGTVTVGVISAKGRANIPLPEGPDFQSFLQTDAAINPGNSGGPLVDIHGKVIGINTAITSPTGGNVGIGFAIPANIAKSVIEELKTEGKVTRGYLGVYLQDISSDIKDALNLPSSNGVLLSEVIDNTPASRAGMKNMDVVLEFDGKKVVDMQSFRIQVASTPVGKKVPVKVYREGKEKMLQVTLGEYPEQLSSAPEQEEDKHLIGLKVVNVTDSRAQRYGLEVSRGVVVITVEPNSPADDAGIREGDAILAIGKKDIGDTEDFDNVIAGLKKGKPVIFHVQRADRKIYVAVTP